MKDVRYKLISNNPEIYSWFKDEYYPDVKEIEFSVDSPPMCGVSKLRGIITKLAERGWKLHQDYQIIKTGWKMQYVEREVKEGEYL